MRILLPPESIHTTPRSPHTPEIWLAQWISDHPTLDESPRVVAYKRTFTLTSPDLWRIHVSADERYELFLDGHRIGRGPERGDLWNWFFESYDLHLPAGPHTLVARTWWQGHLAPFAQMSLRHAFLLAAESADRPDLLSTGVVPWQCKTLPGYEWLPPGQAWGTGAKVRINGPQYDWLHHTAADSPDCQPAVPLAHAVTSQANDQPPTWRLRPAILPPMLEKPTHLGTARLVANAADFPFHDDPYQPQPPVRQLDHLPTEAATWNALLSNQPHPDLIIPPHAARRILIDLNDYHTAYPDLLLSGGSGSLLRLSWAESLHDRLPVAEKREWIGHMPKGQRDTIENKFFHGVTDEFLPDGNPHRHFSTLWWQAGRYVQLLIRTADTPLTIHDLSFRTTHYPHNFAHAFTCSDPRLPAVNQLAQRSLTVGSHEHYVDCPYYEQLQYVGDTRLEALTTYLTTPDSRLPQKAFELLDTARAPDGMVPSRYPSRVLQQTWGFNLWWVAMLHDFMMYRGDKPFLTARLPGARTSLDAALRCLAPDHLPHIPARPNLTFMDWAKGWRGGHPPTTSPISGPFAWQLALVLTLAAELEDYVGEPEMAARYRRHAQQISAAATAALWDESRSLLADDPHKTNFSEHTQILALLSNLLPAPQRDRVAAALFTAPTLDRTTIYFSHYLFEVAHRFNNPDTLFTRLSTWYDLLPLGLKTLPEMPEPTRSDCHPWGAHVLYHSLSTILGLRPASPAFTTVRIQPMLGPLTHASGTIPHPAGPLHIDLHQNPNATLQGQITLPPTIHGTYIHGPTSLPLHPGPNPIPA